MISRLDNLDKLPWSASIKEGKKTPPCALREMTVPVALLNLFLFIPQELLHDGNLGLTLTALNILQTETPRTFQGEF